MAKKVYIKPTKPSLVVGMIVIVLMLFFGIYFMFLISSEPDSYIGIGFLSIWMLVLLLIGGSFLYNYINYDKNPSHSVAEEIQLDDSSLSASSSISFDEKLRKLDQLKKENLITAVEYETKRKEILDEKW